MKANHHACTTEKVKSNGRKRLQSPAFHNHRQHFHPNKWLVHPHGEPPQCEAHVVRSVAVNGELSFQCGDEPVVPMVVVVVAAVVVVDAVTVEAKARKR